jgi:hypothetical protein
MVDHGQWLRANGRLALLAISVFAAGCGVDSAKKDARADRAARASQQATLNGTVEYEKRGVDSVNALLLDEVTLQPVAGVRVEARVGDTVVGESVTDAQGGFVLTVTGVDPNTAVTVRVSAESANPATPVRVTTLQGQTLTLEASVTLVDGAQAQLVAAAADQGGGFNIYTQLIRGLEFVRAADPMVSFPPLGGVWERTGGAASISHFEVGANLVHVVDQPGIGLDAWDDSVILHELGHYLQANLSRDSNPGGAHYGCSARNAQDVDFRLAFSEGWGNAYAQMVLGTPIYVDTADGGGFTQDVEAPCTMVSGPGSENAIMGAFWDLFDGAISGVASTDADGFDMSFAEIWQALIGINADHVYLADFYDALEMTGAISQGEWNTELAPRGLDVPLPPLADALALGVNAQGLVDASLQQESLRAASAYYFVTVAAGTTAVSFAIAGDPAAAELDLEVTSPDNDYYLVRDNGADDRLTLGAPTAGTYLVRIFARDTLPGAVAAPFGTRADVQ